ncbi:MAG: alpha/beta fold hydrolase [Thiomonas sp.]
MSVQPSHPTVLIHGLLGTFQVPDVTGDFAPGWALAPDLLGYGALSGLPPRDINIPAQVAYLRETIRKAFGAEPVHLVGHSIGGAIAALFAHAQPDQVRSVVSVEGNFTLKDAFWSSSVALMSAAAAEQMLSAFRADPAAWLAGAGIAADARTLPLGIHWLAQQPASTVRAMAQSVVAETGTADYLPKVREVFARHPVHLFAGERSRASWDVPYWALQNAASITLLPQTGHLMMLEQPQAFTRAVQSVLNASSSPKPANLRSQSHPTGI